MPTSHRFGCLLATLCLTLTASFAEAGPYSAMYVFGDSLSDSGNDLQLTSDPGERQGPIPTYYTDGTHTGRFTNGLNYADLLAADLGLSLTPSMLGGTNYAHGGARSDYVRADVVQYGVLSFNAQLAQYLGGAAGTADPNALYVLWIGANDMSDALTRSLRQGGNPAPIATEMVQTIGDIKAGLEALALIGAQHFLVGNVPDIALTPSVKSIGSPGVSFLAHQTSISFNSALDAMLATFVTPGIDLDVIDAFGIQTAIEQNPAAYGLTNVRDACYTGEVDGSPLPNGGPVTVCANPNQYAYFDYEHPSAAVHAIVADAVIGALLPEPDALALVFGGLGMLGFMTRRRRHG